MRYIVSILIGFPLCCALDEILSAHSLWWKGKQQDLGKYSWVSHVCPDGRLYLFCSGSSYMDLVIIARRRDCQRGWDKAKCFCQVLLIVKAKYTPIFTKKSSAFCKFVKMQLGLVLNEASHTLNEEFCEKSSSPSLS